MMAASSRVDTQAYHKNDTFRYIGGPDNFVVEETGMLVGRTVVAQSY